MFDVPLSEPDLAGNEWKYVKDCLDTGWVSSVGSYVSEFERRLGEVSGTKHAVAVTSGTAALHLALLVAGVKPGDEVLVSNLTFIAPVNAVTYVGAHPVLIDADPATWQLDAAAAEEFLARCVRSAGGLTNPKTGRRVAALLPVHILGAGADIARLVRAAESASLPVIEDATEALGARCGARALGAWGSMGCLSFNGNKTITTGGGGALITDDASLAQRARYLSTQAKDDPLEFRHDAIGYNYRLSNVAAAIGCAQLERLSAIIDRKRAIASAYQSGLDGIAGLSFANLAPQIFTSAWLTTIRLDAHTAKVHSRTLIEALKANRIEARPLWTPMHSNPPHSSAERIGQGVAERLHSECVSLPSASTLTEAQQQHVIGTIRSILC